MGPGPGIKGPDGFNDQTLPFTFPLAAAGTVRREGPYLLSDLPPRFPLVPQTFFTEPGSQTSHPKPYTRKPAHPFPDLPSVQKCGRIYKMNNSQPWKSLLVLSVIYLKM